MTLVSQSVEITNVRGLHARSSAKFVGLATTLGTPVMVAKDDNSVVGTSIMGLMMLGAAKGDTITISAEGAGATDAVRALVELVSSKFGED